MILKHKCAVCDSNFKLEYDEILVEDSPTFCPFCSEYISIEEMEQDEDY